MISCEKISDFRWAQVSIPLQYTSFWHKTVETEMFKGLYSVLPVIVVESENDPDIGVKLYNSLKTI